MGILLLIDGILNRTALLHIHCTFWQGTCRTVFNAHQQLFSTTAYKVCCISRKRRLERKAEKVHGYRHAISQDSKSHTGSIIKREKKGNNAIGTAAKRFKTFSLVSKKIKYSLVKALLGLAHAWHLKRKIKWRTGVFMSSRNSAKAFLTSYTIWFMFLQGFNPETGAPEYREKAKTQKIICD